MSEELCNLEEMPLYYVPQVTCGFIINAFLQFQGMLDHVWNEAGHDYGQKKKSIFFPLCNLLSQICFLRSEEERRKVILVSFILFLSILHVKMIQ